MTTLTIVVPDNLVILNGKAHTVDCSGLAGMQAVQWSGSGGQVEYQYVNGSKLPPTNLSDISMFQPEIDAWTAADNYVPPPPPPPTRAQLLQYAADKQTRIAQGGFTVNANTSGAALNVSVSTNPAYANYLSSAGQLAQMMVAGTIPTANFNWIQDSGNLSLTPQQVINIGVAIGALVQQSFTVRGEVVAAINAGTITTTAEIDSPPSPIPAWPVNS